MQNGVHRCALNLWSSGPRTVCMGNGIPTAKITVPGGQVFKYQALTHLVSPFL